VDVESSAALATGLLEGQGWRQMGELGAALVLSAGIGVQGEIRQKNAGLRTHTLVGLGSALFMLMSKYGFNDVLQTGVIVLDPIYHRRALGRAAQRPIVLGPDGQDSSSALDSSPMVEIRLHVHGKHPVSEFAAALSEVDGVASVLVGNGQAADD
jgi:hypothetical protein